jgi:hypothetical protein
MLTRGIWPFKWRWYSYCSRHMSGDEPECKLCQRGRWRNVVVLGISQALFPRWPRIWQFFVNLKSR